MKTIGKQFLKATDGGLNIIRKYLTTPFELDEIVQSDVNTNRTFKVFWSELYKNYVITIYNHGTEEERLNAIWFVKWLFEITEVEVYKKLDKEMNLNIMNAVAEDSGARETHEAKVLSQLEKLR